MRMSDIEKINKKLNAAGLPEVDDDGKAKYIMSGGDHPAPLLIFENICRLVERDPKLCGDFRLNDFSHMIETIEDGRWTNLHDMKIYATQRYISSNYRAFAKSDSSYSHAAD